MVKEGDAGEISLLDNDALPITREFDKMVDEIIKLAPCFDNDEKQISQAV